MPVLPRYPVYVPSKDRADTCFTARCLQKDGVPFFLVVEEEQAEQYAARFGRDCLLLLPFSNQGLFAARNWIKQHAIQSGAERHWQLDDNIKYFSRRYKGKRLYVDAGIALRVCEDFTDRYENIAISGLNYTMFAPDGQSMKPFYLNVHVYSCTLIRNDLDIWWRLLRNDDTDMCLQVLAAGWCTVLLNVFLCRKEQTMTVNGGNTQQLYQGDGRLKMARDLERLWPGVVQTKRRFRRPQHVVKDDWKYFDTPLKLKPGIDLAALAQQANEYGMSLQQVTPQVRSPRMQRLLASWQESHADTDTDTDSSSSES